jgi:hypothetical protein
MEAPPRVPLSQALLRIVESGDTPTMRLDELMADVDGRGRYLVLILLALPFITPLPLPALSNFIGIVVIFLALRLYAQRPPALPSFIGRREVARIRMKAIAGAASVVLRGIEKLVKPRSGTWIERLWVQRANALLLTWMGLCLALPLPPALPFTHMLPCWTIIILSLSMMERDGRLIFLGYALAFGTTIYMIFFVSAIFVASHKLWNWFKPS